MDCSPLIVPVVYDRCGISQPEPCNKKLRNKNVGSCNTNVTNNRENEIIINVACSY